VLESLLRFTALLAGEPPDRWSSALAVLVTAAGGDAATVLAGEARARLGGAGVMPVDCDEPSLRNAGFTDVWTHTLGAYQVVVAARGGRPLERALLDAATPMIDLALDAHHKTVVFAEETARRRAMEERIVELERQATVGLVASAVAHDLSAPVTAMLIEVGDIRKAALELSLHLANAGPVMKTLLTEIVELSEACAESADRARVLTMDFQASAHPGGEEHVLEVNVGDALSSSVRMLAPFSRTRARVEQQIAPRLPIIRGSRRRLKQVFTNLLMNAIHAASDRGDGAGLVQARCTADVHEIRVEIADNGPGIPDEVIPKIWEPFFTTKPEGVGTGLGLAIVREIVRGHGGRIELETKIARGTTFRVILPIAPVADEPRGGSSTPRARSSPGIGSAALHPAGWLPVC
jgi:signal transduction histidine kinase